MIFENFKIQTRVLGLAQQFSRVKWNWNWNPPNRTQKVCPNHNMAKRKREQSRWQQSKWRPKQKDTWYKYNTRNFQRMCAEKCRSWLRTTYALNHGADCSLCGATKADRKNLGAHKYLHGAHAGIEVSCVKQRFDSHAGCKRSQYFSKDSRPWSRS